MNNDLISREALKTTIKNSFKHNLHGYDALLINEIDEFIDNAPTVKNEYMRGYEAAVREYKRPQGEWKYTHDTFSKRICNKCNYSQVIVDGMSDNFCPNCGADMRGGENDK